MRLLHRFVIAGSGIVMLLLGPLAAQGGVTLDSRPQGVHVLVEGPRSFSGRTPLLLDQWPEGDYLLRASRLGLATAASRVRCTGKNNLTTSSWVGASAVLLPPGFAQYWRTETRRGALFLGAGIVGGTLVVQRESARRSARNEVEQASRAYENAISEAEIALTRTNLLASTQKESDERQLRSLWGGYLGAVWAGAALDAWLLSPRATLLAQPDGSYLLGVPRAGAWQAGWRSFLVPGSGQLYLGRYQRGNFFSAAVMALAAGALAADESYLDSRRDQADAQRRYDAAETEAEVLRRRQALDGAANETSDRNVVRWSLLLAAGGAYLWNVADAMLLGHGDASLSDVNYSVLPERDGLRLAVTWRLP